MLSNPNIDLVSRFLRLPLEQRQQFYQRLQSRGMSFAQLPIAPTRHDSDTPTLSYAQERQWFLWQLDKDSTAYHIPGALRLHGHLDLAALQRSFDSLLARHESLRTQLVDDGQRLWQAVMPQARVQIQQAHVDQAQLMARVEEEVARPFDLHQAPLLRVTLLQLAEDEHVLVMVQHHIVSDGWSMQVMVEELVQLYAAHNQGHDLQLPELPIQYADYALWQRGWMEAGEQARQLAYWQALLGGEQPVLELPLDRPRPAQQSHRGASLQVHLQPTLVAGLKRLAQQEGVTAFMLLLASFQALLYRYSGQSDIRIGVPNANRNRVETERLIGFFVNTQVLKADLDGQMRFAELLQQTKRRALEAQAHQDLPFEQLVVALQPERSLSHNPLFQVMFNHQTDAQGGREGQQLPGLRVVELDWDSQTTHFDLSLDTHESADGLWAALTYAADLFDAATIERLAQHWQHLLQAVVSAPRSRLCELPIVGAAEQHRMLQDWNTPAGVTPFEAVHRLFEAQADQQPERQALALDEQTLSYGELNRQANRLAHYLLAQGVGPQGLVGIAVERSFAMVVSLLAVLKTGAAYVPLDPEYPRERLAHMLEDSGVGLVLTQSHLHGRLPLPAQVLAVDIDRVQAQLALRADDNLPVEVEPQSLAYVIYTSGSTGKPKGVAISHAALSEFAGIAADYSQLVAQDRVLQFATLNFDGFVEQLYPALTLGATVVLRGPQLWDGAELYRQIIAQGITLADLPTAYWKLFLQDCLAAGPRTYGALRQIHIGGEAMPLDGPLLWQRAGLGHVRLLNTYGPTEATVVSSVLDCTDPSAVSAGGASPIGRALPGRGLYVLDRDLNLLPLGAVGELYIASANGLARAYLQRPGLTAERFVADPFSPSGERLYRTGDLARYRADGVVEYVGRVDHQVKVRGFRIELGEIETVLLAQDSVREALLLAADNQLLAYLVPAQTLSETERAEVGEQLMATLRDHLPDYMVPAHLIFLERMPLNPNGKLDRQALPKPDASVEQQDWRVPVTPLQQQVAAIWAAILGAERVGLNQHFFELGGHSLLAMQVVSRIRQTLSLEVPLKAVFEHPRLEAFVAAMQAQESPSPTAPALLSAGRVQPLPLSYAQERQWFLWQLEPHSAAYHIPSALRLKGQLDLAALQRSFDSLLARHESLRTHIRQDHDGAVQVIEPPMSLPITQADADEAQLNARVQALIAQPFDLQEGPLLRVTLLRLAADEHVLVLVQHHIVSDGWSMQLVVEELVQLYAGYSQGQDVQLPALPIQYADYAVWQRSWMDAGEKQRQLAYWRELLGGEQSVLELPFDHQRPAVQSHRGARLAFELTPELTQGLKALAQQQGVTLFMLLLASFQTLLHRYSGQEEIRVGVPIANRNRSETERLIGFFVNTQVLKADVHGQMSVEQLLQHVRQRALQAQAHQDLPFEQLVEALQPERSLSHNPLFQVMFNHQTDVGQAQVQHQLPGLRVEGLDWDSKTAHFDLDLDIQESTEGIWATLGYAQDLFEASTVQRMARHWQNLLQGMVANPRQQLSQLSLLDATEQQQILQLWNRTESGFSAERLVHELVGDRARETPDAVAVKFDAQTLTYGELDRQANRLAHALIARGVGPEVRVAIAMPRSAEIMVAFLAVMKAGGVYVPLDIEYPHDRLLYMMQDSRSKLLLTHSAVQHRLPIPDGLEALAVDQVQAWSDYSDAAPDVALDGDNLAYVIYTSGSTGLPKGVAVSHGPLVAHIIATGERYETSPADCELHFMSFAFDGSHEGWMHPLINGASVLIRDDSLWLPEYTYEQMHRHNVTMAVFPPVYLQQLAEHAERDGNPPAVRVYCFGGDAVAQASYDLAWRALKPKYLFNGYGPTETVVTPLLWKARKGDPCGAVYAPIGTLLGNRSGYVLDAQLNLQPIGVAGELYLGGEGVARGYLERPALTAERFVPDPFGKPGSRVYRSGDLTRGRPDGVVDYLGRVDHQVKIRGFRIELGEIEARLREQTSVGETVVVAQEGPTGKQLVAYVVPLDRTLLDDAVAQSTGRETLRRALKTRLPDYMVPTHLMFLERMPLTPNGKLDRKGLPLPDVSQMQQVYVAPESELEQQVAAIWAQILGVERVGLADHFFESGGHSLLAMQVISRLRQLLGREVPLRTMFEQPRLQGFVETLCNSHESQASVLQILPVSRQQPLALSYAQERQWFLWQLDPHSAAYHVPSTLRLRGWLDHAALQRSFDSLVARHESLRTQVHQDEGQAFQIIRENGTVAILHEQVNEADLQRRVETEIAQPFDLQQGPLLRVTLLRLAEDDHVLVLVQHHIVSDGWSMQVMVDELVQLYAAYSQGQDLQLPALPIQYADYAQWQRDWMTGGERDRQMGYWQALLGGEPSVLELPLDRPRPSVQSFRGASLEIKLAPALVEGLKALAQREDVTLFIVLLASFQALLHRYSGQQDIRVGVPIANRNRVETERLVGFFVNTQVLKGDFDAQLTVTQLLQQAKHRALDAQSHQDLPFEQLVEALQPERSLSRNPLFQVLFNHQSQARLASTSQQLPDLRIESLEWGTQTAQFDLSLDTQETVDGLWATLTYATDLFDAATPNRMARHWQNLLQAMLDDPHQRVAQLPLLEPLEHQVIVEQWNDTAQDYRLEDSVQRQIEAQVRRTPNAQALVFGAQTLSYTQLNARANRLAHRLIQAGVAPDVLVGVAMERSIEMVVALLAVLKAGGAYVPLDPDYPRERLAYMLQDSNVPLLLTQAHLLQALPVSAPSHCLVVEPDDHWLSEYADTDPDVAVDAENLAYVIYTSGSTGQPKGAGNRHCALTNRLLWMQQAYTLGAEDTVLQKTPFSFDVSVWEFFWPLMTGARLVVAAPGDHRDPSKLVELINRHQVTTLHFVPSMLHAFLQDSQVASCQGLRRIICSGEALPVGVQQHVFAQLPNTGLFNLYGPTEAAIDVTHWTCVDEHRDSVPIGRPISNLRTYVLDAQLQPVAVGVAGELYLGGVGLARSYHRRPSLTAERFVPCPFQPGTRLYRTGDRVRQRRDGVIEYIGRLDHQVKLRGLRIELGEIEARLLEHPLVRDASVQVHEGKYLVGYVVLQDSTLAWRDALSTHLLAHVPDYMVPAQWVLLDHMPLSPNGKLDRKALPAPDSNLHERHFVAARNTLEQALVAIWREVLELEQVSVEDNFFELGGHSLLVLMLKERIRKAVGVELSVSQLMLNPSVAGQAACLEGSAGSSLIVRLNSQSRGTPLYLFHPSYGSVHCYKAIALALREHRPVMGVMCRALAEEGSEVPAWAAMVEDYTTQLLKAQPEGPFRLAGWSLGGNLAMEVAYGLEQAGRQVECVGWIDASPPQWVKPFWDTAVMVDERDISANERRVELLEVMFPEFSQQIHAHWSELQCLEAAEGEQWTAFSHWAEETLGSRFGELKDELLSGHEAQISWEVDRILGQRLHDADFKAIKAPISCWWATLSRTGVHHQLIEASMLEVAVQSTIERSVLIETSHDRLIDNAEFVHSFAAAMS
ncbi:MULTISPECIES: amino acid adenylation domain-containing protein [unclassified Pseudomonas]|uniref:amino acid adenylation domain-containing protein n=1 Tax=unclassified Pseudomonas TaxID=196821 RepID=UPI00190D57D4|nr:MULTISPECIES: non-ribosomal peptide synthetase [unclassified Pseudomonas]MBK3434232.1 amino acid adenylation domain-containing protein [Pseudomonas fluorescens]MBK3481833.1 amino acid adenylation domain-containing protein [Pseudomonas fluorescens]MEB0191362.1 amino acid adenylation domain-containing protein [Pseudomonas sp. CCI1.1]WPX50057.1 amino acid adenylation domain-containing protein [Pseudomonas sp. CCI1.1]